MSVIKTLFAFYINSSIHVAIAVSALVGVTDLSVTLQLSWHYYAFVFLGTVTGYNFVKYAKVAGLHHRSLTKSLREIQVFSALCALGLIAVVIQLPIRVILYTAGFGIFTFFYAVPFIAGYNLRSIVGIKVFVVALVWAGMTVVVPIAAAETFFSFEIWVQFFQHLLLVVVWLLPFEIRDMKYDKLSLGTIPQNLGVNRTKALGVILLFVVFLMEINRSNTQIWNISAGILMIVISGVLLVRSKNTQGIYYASFWVESIPIFWFLLTYLFFYFSL